VSRDNGPLRGNVAAFTVSMRARAVADEKKVM
jgi:hypothetical protein